MTAQVLPLPEPPRLASDTLAAIQAIYEERREANGLRQDALAEAIGRPQSYVSRVLSGTKVLNLGDVENFARGYGMTVLELMERAVSAAAAPAPVFSPEFHRRNTAENTPCGLHRTAAATGRKRHLSVVANSPDGLHEGSAAAERVASGPAA